MSGQPAGHHERPLLGFGLVAVAALTFALSDVTVKHLTASYPVPVIAAARYLFSFVLLTAALAPRLGPGLWRTKRTGLVILRGLCLSLATLTMGWALRVMPVGETVAILYLSPFVVMLLAVPLLGEKVGIFAWLGAGIGFFGVLLVVRPGSGLDPLGVVFAVVNAGLAVAYQLLSRSLSKTESTSAMMFYVTIAGAVLFTILALPDIGKIAPTWPDLGLMCFIGLLATLGHFMLTAAYREAPASLLAPVTYLHLFWAGGLGWLVFGHIPDNVTLAGMVLIAASGIAIAIRSHLIRRRAPVPAPAEG